MNCECCGSPNAFYQIDNRMGAARYICCNDCGYIEFDMKIMHPQSEELEQEESELERTLVPLAKILAILNGDDEELEKLERLEWEDRFNQDD